MTTDHASIEIKPREQLNFKLNAAMPRFWNGGDPYKTRFFDAMSVTFPIGERYFISSVRAYRDDIQDLKLAAEVKDFIRQEAQHGMVHTEFNDLLAKQGMAIKWAERFLDRKFKWQTSRWSKAFNLSYTAAAEHLTAMMGATFIQRPDIFKDADSRMKAI
jgi:predicted metal-dependent hydrolase